MTNEKFSSLEGFLKFLLTVAISLLVTIAIKDGVLGLASFLFMTWLHWQFTPTNKEK